MNPNRGINLRILLYNSSVKIKMLLLEDMLTGKVKRALSTLAEIRSLLPQLVSDLTCGQKKWQKRAEVVVNLKYELSLHPSILRFDVQEYSHKMPKATHCLRVRTYKNRILEISNFKLK